MDVVGTVIGAVDRVVLPPLFAATSIALTVQLVTHLRSSGESEDGFKMWVDERCDDQFLVGVEIAKFFADKVQENFP